MPRRARTKSDVGNALLNEVRNPLIDDLPDDVSVTAHRRDSVARNGEQGEGLNALGDMVLLRSLSSSLGATNHTLDDEAIMSMQSNRRLSTADATAKLGINAVCRAAKQFAHVMHMNNMDVYFTSRETHAKESGVRRVLDGMEAQERFTFVYSLLEILEDIRVERGKISQLCGSALPEESLLMERLMSTSITSNMSTASLARPPVHETHRVAMRWDKRGNMMINRYIILANLGRGAYGRVKLGEEVDTGRKVAIKIISKKRLKKKIGFSAAEYDDALSREIAIMKKVRHRNCVSLYEVIDDPASQRLYLIMDYIPNGPVVRLQPQRFTGDLLAAIEAGEAVDGVLYNRYLVRCAVRHELDSSEVPLREEEMEQEPTLYTCRPLRQTLCANYLRQLVSGLRYMHKRNVVHHDIKPDNILLGYGAHVYLTDFGVSEIMESGATSDVDEEHSTPPLAQRTPRSPATSERSPTTPTSTRSWYGEGPRSGKEDGDAAEHPLRAARTSTASGARRGAGTLLFTAPELFDLDLDPSRINPFATDVWALGVTLYCMLVGCAPFNGECYADVVHSVRTQPVPWNGMNLHSHYLIPQWLTILEGLLDKDPAKRWLLVDVKNYLDGEEFQSELQLQSAMEMSQTNSSQAVARVALGTPTTMLPQAQPPQQQHPSPLKLANTASRSTHPGHGLRADKGTAEADAPRNPNEASPARRPTLSQLRRQTVSARMERMSMPLSVSAKELREALVRQRVEVIPKKKIHLSPHARMKVHEFVIRLRRRCATRGGMLSFRSNACVDMRAGSSEPSSEAAMRRCSVRDDLGSSTNLSCSSSSNSSATTSNSRSGSSSSSNRNNGDETLRRSGRCSDKDANSSTSISDNDMGLARATLAFGSTQLDTHDTLAQTQRPKSMSEVACTMSSYGDWVNSNYTFPCSSSSALQPDSREQPHGVSISPMNGSHGSGRAADAAGGVARLYGQPGLPRSSEQPESSTLDALLSAVNLQSVSSRLGSISLSSSISREEKEPGPSTTRANGTMATTVPDTVLRQVNKPPTRAASVNGRQAHGTVREICERQHHGATASLASTSNEQTMRINDGEGVGHSSKQRSTPSSRDRLQPPSPQNISQLFTDTMPQKLLCHNKLAVATSTLSGPAEKSLQTRLMITTDTSTPWSDSATTTSVTQSPPMTAWELVAAVPASEGPRRGWRARVSMRK